MTDLFYELYGSYFAAAEKLAAADHTDRAALSKILSAFLSYQGATDVRSSIFLKKEWKFLKLRDDGVDSLVTQAEERPLTDLERAFLRTVVQDPRAGVFLTDERLALLREKLGNGPTLFTPDMIESYDRSAHGDPYTDPVYRANAQTLLKIIEQGGWARIEYRNGQNDYSERICQPHVLEYSGKDDRFRVRTHRVDGKERMLNIARMLKVEPVEVTSPAEQRAWRECAEPLLIEVSTERGAVRRFLHQFSYLKKETEINRLTGTARVRLWYPECDETEILIRLLSFGPIIRVLEPQSFIRKIRERVSLQTERLE